MRGLFQGNRQSHGRCLRYGGSFVDSIILSEKVDPKNTAFEDAGMENALDSVQSVCPDSRGNKRGRAVGIYNVLNHAYQNAMQQKSRRGPIAKERESKVRSGN